MDKEVLGHFSSIADQLIKEFGAKEAIQRAMAIISGNTKKIHARSLITGTENMVTFLFKNNQEVRSLSWVWNCLKRIADEALVSEVKWMR